MEAFIGRSLLVLVLAMTSAALSQAPNAPLKPGPEHKRLGYFEGKWTAEGQQKENPFGPAGPYSAMDTCEWFMDGFFLKCTSEGKDPAGEMKSFGLLGYDTDSKVYTYYGVDSRGRGESGKGTLKGGTWTYSATSKMKGKTIKSRYVIKETSPTEYSYKWELADEKGNWTTLAEGKETKVK